MCCVSDNVKINEGLINHGKSESAALCEMQVSPRDWQTMERVNDLVICNKH